MKSWQQKRRKAKNSLFRLALMFFSQTMFRARFFTSASPISHVYRRQQGNPMSFLLMNTLVFIRRKLHFLIMHWLISPFNCFDILLKSNLILLSEAENAMATNGRHWTSTSTKMTWCQRRFAEAEHGLHRIKKRTKTPFLYSFFSVGIFHVIIQSPCQHKIQAGELPANFKGMNGRAGNVREAWVRWVHTCTAGSYQPGPAPASSSAQRCRIIRQKWHLPPLRSL